MSLDEHLDQAAEWLSTSVRSERLAHAFIVAGAPRGSGRELAARLIRLLYADSDFAGDPCAHPDVMWIEPRKKSRAISIEQIRDAQQRMSQTSYSGGWKVCVIIAADRMSNEAANAFLKTLEEPQGRSVFLLLTDAPQELLPTISSRCQQIILPGESEDLVPEWQEELLGVLKTVSRGDSMGSLAAARRMLALLDDVKKVVRGEVEASAEEEEEAEVTEARISARYREVRSTVLKLIQLWYRDILLCVCGVTDDQLYFSAMADDTRDAAASMSYREAIARVGAVDDMKRQLDENLDDASVFSLGFSRLCAG